MRHPKLLGTPELHFKRVFDHIQEHLAEEISLEDLAAVAGTSSAYFSAQFKQSTGLTPHRFLVDARISRAKELLEHTDLSIASIAALVGFSDQSHLARHFRKSLGLAPSVFIKRHPRMN